MFSIVSLFAVVCYLLLTAYINVWLYKSLAIVAKNCEMSSPDMKNGVLLTPTHCLENVVSANADGMWTSQPVCLDGMIPIRYQSCHFSLARVYDLSMYLGGNTRGRFWKTQRIYGTCGVQTSYGGDIRRSRYTPCQ